MTKITERLNSTWLDLTLFFRLSINLKTLLYSLELHSLDLFYKWIVKWWIVRAFSMWQRNSLAPYHIVLRIRIDKKSTGEPYMVNITIIIISYYFVLWGQTNMAHPQCMIKYVSAIILFIYYTLLAPCACACVSACQQHWILCELLSPNTECGNTLFAGK